MGAKIRLDKFLTEMGVGTRSQVKEYARKGRISVNGKVVVKSEEKIDPEQDQITFDEMPVAYAAYEYYMLNKPQGVISATEDKKYTTVVDLIKERIREDLFPVGRLDIDTEGLLLITNDGDLCHRLLSPRHHVDKVYFAHIAGEIPSDAKEQFLAGVTLEDGIKTMPADLVILGKVKEDPSLTQIRLTIHEGKFHQVKRMFEAIGCEVVFLKRLSMGSLSLDPSLAPGDYRKLTDVELDALKTLCKMEG